MAPEITSMHPGVWIGFLTIIFALLALDLGVLHEKDSIPTGISLGVVAGILAVGVGASMWVAPKK